MKIGNRVFKDSGKTYIMAILNVTPDSFSDGGKYFKIDDALKHVEKIVKEGADIIDIGGQSTRPGYKPVGYEEEIKRVIPVVEKIKNNFDIPVSVDTFRSDIAKDAIDAGADMINDIWGLRYNSGAVGSHDSSEPSFDNIINTEVEEDDTEHDLNEFFIDSKMADIISRGHVSVCIMHNSLDEYAFDYNNAKKTGNKKTVISNNIDKIITELRGSVHIALSAGISRNRIMVDPGIGFAKDYNMNMASIANLTMFRKLGFPVLLGTSEKSVIGKTLDLPVGERLEGTLTTTILAVLAGCSFIRVHNVKDNKRAVKMAEEIMKYRL